MTQGGTLADLRAYIESKGGHVIGATTLGNAEFGHMMCPQDMTLAALRPLSLTSHGAGPRPPKLECAP